MDNLTTLQIPSSLKLLQPTLDFAVGYAGALGMSGRSLDEIRLGLEEAIVNVIEHGYQGDASQTIDLECGTDGSSLIFVIHEKGLPFDPEMMAGEGNTADPARGIGLRMIKRFMDEVTFSCPGMAGKEIRLVKHFTRTVSPPAEAPHPSVPAAAVDEPYTVRLMRPDEAVEVSRSAYYAYGYSYRNENIYDPVKVRELNRTGRMLSFVAVTDSGEVMGHAALVPGQETPDIYEMALAFVKPKFRNRSCLKRLTTALLDEARSRKAGGVYVEAVCNHPYSQKAAHDFGLSPSAILLARIPPSRFLGIADNQERISFLIASRSLSPATANLYLPVRHEKMLGRIYGWSSVERAFARSPEAAAFPAAPPALSVRRDNFSTETIRVEEYGEGIVGTVGHYLHEACLDGIQVLYLSLNLTDPLTPAAVPLFEDLGFFFAGVMAGPGGRDRLVLQYLNNLRVAFSSFRMASDEDRELLAYVRQCAGDLA